MNKLSDNITMVLVMLAVLAMAGFVFLRVVHFPDTFRELKLYFPELF